MRFDAWQRWLPGVVFLDDRKTPPDKGDALT